MNFAGWQHTWSGLKNHGDIMDGQVSAMLRLGTQGHNGILCMRGPCELGTKNCAQHCCMHELALAFCDISHTVM